LLPNVPADPITGKPLHYKFIDDRPVVYSVGIDGDDDAGRLPKNTSGHIQPDLAQPVNPGPHQNGFRISETDGDWVLWSGPPAKTAAGDRAAAPSS
jgi:hypothetical protein